MVFDREEIEDVLKEGQIILSSRPELVNMDLHDIINELDDGTPEMIRNRWGVAAWVIVKSINDFSVRSLVETLSNIESNILIYEYVGYLLLTRFGVNLENLILCAEKNNKFDKIVFFVSDNLIYESQIYEDHILSIIDMMGNHLDHNSYRSFLHNYAEHIAIFKAQKLVEEKIGEINRQVQYDLMDNLCSHWYADNVEEATNALERLLNRKGFWNEKLAIRFLDVSLHYDEFMFQKHFERIEEMVLTNNQLWLITIPLFVKYIIFSKKIEVGSSDCTQSRVLAYLEKLPERTLDEKYAFLNFMLYQKGTPKNLKLIFESILEKPFDKEPRFLNVVDYHLCNYLKDGEWSYALQLMKKVFVANQYYEDFENFFRALSLTSKEMEKYSAEVAYPAIKDILSGDIKYLFWGIGLLMEYGSIQSLIEKKDNTKTFLSFTLTNAQMIRILKAILYFSINSQKVCCIAFQLLELSNSSNEQYIKFCLEEIFENYPATMYKVAEQYTTSTEKDQKILARKTIYIYERRLDDQKQCYEIMDLRPSKEHDYIHQKALAEQNKRIQKQANKQSLFAALMTSRVLKYGVRNAHIMIGRKGQMIFQVGPYAHIQHEVELPMLYIRDPVGFTLRNQAYLKEVVSDASNHKGLSDFVERER